jgi:hypothetical protein
VLTETNFVRKCHFTADNTALNCETARQLP